jgi:putative membrane protein
MFMSYLKSKFRSNDLNYPMTILQGIVMGIVETIPGVSASTLALIMGIYDRFVDLLHQFSDVFKEKMLFFAGKSTPRKVWGKVLDIDYKFGGLLFFGMFTGIGIFSHIMSFLLTNYPAYTYGFFFGLIIASVSVPWSRIKKKTRTEWLIAGITAVVFFVFLGFKPAVIVGIPSPFLVFVAGFFAICAMVLPGISGSFVLLLFGLYDYVIEAVKNLTKLNVSQPEIINLFALAAGLTFGFATFVRLLKYILLKYPTYLMATLVGLMLGSLRVLWPFPRIEEGANYNTEMLMVSLVIIGTILVVCTISEYATKETVLKEI